MPLIRNFTALFVLFSLLSGCAGNQLKDDDDNLLDDISSSSSKSKHAKIPEAGPLIKAASYRRPATRSKQIRPKQRTNSSDTWGRMFRNFRLGNHMGNPIVRSVANEYTRKSDIVSTMTTRSTPYLHMIISEVERRRMPAEVALVPFIESGFNPKAYSHSGAAGLWQFIPSTGKAYGLPRGNQFDARLDPFAATNAALNYLQKLEKQFNGDWLLAFAAYNAGEGRVSRAVTKFKQQNPGQRVSFWRLELPEETKHYVPKLLAFKDVLLRPQQYGYRLPNIPNAPHLVQVRVNKPVNLRLVASRAGLPQYTLTDLNPYFLKGVTSPSQSNRVVLPRRHAAQINNAIRTLPPAYASNIKSKTHSIKYTVRKGDNLQKIAKMHGIPMKTILSLNGKHSTNIYAGESLSIS